VKSVCDFLRRRKSTGTCTIESHRYDFPVCWTKKVLRITMDGEEGDLGLGEDDGDVDDGFGRLRLLKIT
jgi:hypothetical protein